MVMSIICDIKSVDCVYIHTCHYNICSIQLGFCEKMWCLQWKWSAGCYIHVHVKMYICVVQVVTCKNVYLCSAYTTNLCVVPC